MKKLTVLLFAYVAFMFICSSASADSLEFNVSIGVPAYSQTLDDNGHVTSITYSVPIEIQTFLSYFYIGQTAELATVAKGTNAISFTLQNVEAPMKDDTLSKVSTSFTSSDAPVESSGDFLLSEQTVRHFTLTVTLLNPSMPNTFYRLSLRQIRVAHLGMSPRINFELLSPGYFHTEYRFINGTTTNIQKAIDNDLLQVSSCPAGIRIYPEKDAMVEIYSINGQKVLTTNVRGGEAQIFSSLTPGVYIVKSFIEGYTVTKKAVVN